MQVGLHLSWSRILQRRDKKENWADSVKSQLMNELTYKTWLYISLDTQSKQKRKNMKGNACIKNMTLKRFLIAHDV